MNPAADMVKKSTVLAKEAEDILVKKGVVEGHKAHWVGWTLPTGDEVRSNST